MSVATNLKIEHDYATLNNMGKNHPYKISDAYGESLENSYAADEDDIKVKNIILKQTETFFLIGDDGCGMDCETIRNNFFSIKRPTEGCNNLHQFGIGAWQSALWLCEEYKVDVEVFSIRNGVVNCGHYNSEMDIYNLQKLFSFDFKGDKKRELLKRIKLNCGDIISLDIDKIKHGTWIFIKNIEREKELIENKKYLMDTYSYRYGQSSRYRNVNVYIQGEKLIYKDILEREKNDIQYIIENKVINFKNIEIIVNAVQLPQKSEENLNELAGVSICRDGRLIGVGLTIDGVRREKKLSETNPFRALISYRDIELDKQFNYNTTKQIEGKLKIKDEILREQLELVLKPYYDKINNYWASIKKTESYKDKITEENMKGVNKYIVQLLKLGGFSGLIWQTGNPRNFIKSKDDSDTESDIGVIENNKGSKSKRKTKHMVGNNYLDVCFGILEEEKRYECKYIIGNKLDIIINSNNKYNNKIFPNDVIDNDISKANYIDIIIKSLVEKYFLDNNIFDPSYKDFKKKEEEYNIIYFSKFIQNKKQKKVIPQLKLV